MLASLEMLGASLHDDGDQRCLYRRIEENDEIARENELPLAGGKDKFEPHKTNDLYSAVQHDAGQKCDEHEQKSAPY